LKEPDQLSGDIDVAVEADVTLVKTAVEQLALNGQFRHMPGLNVYSFARLHGSKIAQVDIIPTTNLKLAKWAYYNAPNDLKLGLKGSHRNELLFAIAKYAEYKVTARAADGQETARSRLAFDLSRGLYRSTQDKAGKRGITKSFKTTGKSLITSDPDKICTILFGSSVSAKQVMTYGDAFKLMMSSSFPHKAQLKEILKRAVEGLESKKLVVPAELRQACTSKLNEASTLRSRALLIQQAIVDALPKHNVKIEDGGKEVVVYDHLGDKLYDVSIANLLGDDAALPHWVANLLGDDAALPHWVKLHVAYAERTAFLKIITAAGFKRNHVNYTQEYELTLDDRRLIATTKHPLTIYVSTLDRFSVERVRVRDVEQTREAIAYSKTVHLDDNVIQRTIADGPVEKIFEEVEYSKRVMLSLQQKFIGFETPRGREFDDVKMSGGVLHACLRCQHYNWTFGASHVPYSGNRDRLRVTLKASGGDYDTECSYIIRRVPNEERILMFVDGGALTDGEDEAVFDTWEQALNKLMSELTAIFSDQDE
jgi:hypothetical protein